MPDSLLLDRPPDGSVHPLYQRPGFMIRRAHQIVTAIFDEVAQGAITQTQFAALYILRQRPFIDQITLAKLIGHDRSTTALVVRKLEKAGLAARTPDTQDRRRNLLRVTDAGEALLKRTVGIAHHSQARVLSVFTEEEAETFCRLLGRLVGAFNDKIRAPLTDG